MRQELTDAMADNSALSKALQMKDVALEKAMHEYKSQVVRADSHFSAETMVESLTEQNLALEERCQHLEEVRRHDACAQGERDRGKTGLVGRAHDEKCWWQVESDARRVVGADTVGCGSFGCNAQLYIKPF